MLKVAIEQDIGERLAQRWRETQVERRITHPLQDLPVERGGSRDRGDRQQGPERAVEDVLVPDAIEGGC